MRNVPRRLHSWLRPFRSGLFVALMLMLLPLAAFGQGKPIMGSGTIRLTPSAASVQPGNLFDVAVVVDIAGVTGVSPSGGSTPVVLAQYTISVAFDRTRLQFVSSAGGTTSGFSSVPSTTGTSKANTDGVVTINSVQSSSTTPTGVISVAALSFKALATGSPTVSASGNLTSALQFGATSQGPATFPVAPGMATIQIAGPAVPPSTPFNPVPNDGNSSAPSPTMLSWTAPGADSSDVYFGTSMPAPLFATVAGTTLTVPTQPATRYYWQVTAKNSAGSTPGPVWSFSTVDCSAPPATQLTAPATVSSQASYQVSWLASSGATQYTIEEALDAAFTLPVPRVVTGGILLAAFAHTVTHDTRYYYRVTPKNNAGNCDATGAISTSVSVLVQTGSSRHRAVLHP